MDQRVDCYGGPAIPRLVDREESVLTGPRSPRRKSGRWRITKGNQGEREALDLLTKAGWIVMNGAMAENGVDLIAYWRAEHLIDTVNADFYPYTCPHYILHAEAKNEPWSARGRAYLGPVCERWEAKGILYRVLTKESTGWTVRAIRRDGLQVRTVYKAPATVPNLTLGGLLTGSVATPATASPRAIEEE